METRRSNGRIWIIVFLLLLVLDTALVLLLVRGLRAGQWPFVPRGGAGGAAGEIGEVLSGTTAYSDENSMQLPAVSGQATEPDPAAVPGQTTVPGQSTAPGQSAEPGQATVPGQATEPDPATVPGQVTEPDPAAVPGPVITKAPIADRPEDIRTMRNYLTDEARIWIDPDLMYFDSAAERYEMTVTLTLVQRHGRDEVERLQAGDTIRFGNETIAIRSIAFYEGRADGRDGVNKSRYCSINDEEWALVYDADRGDYCFATFWIYDSSWYAKRYEAGQYLVRVSPDADVHDAYLCIYSVHSPADDYIRVEVPRLATYLESERASIGGVFPIECKARFDADGVLTFLWILYVE